jgi:excisionase family DNA binding protein
LSASRNSGRPIGDGLDTENETMARLTVEEAAEYVRLGVSTLNTYRVKGGGPVYIKMGATVRYDTEDLDVWLEEKKRQSTSAAEKKPPRGKSAA